MIIGLTGSSGSGKSAAAVFFEQRGFYILDFDKISRTVCEPGKPCLAELAEAFGGGIIAPDGALRRKALGEIVFADRAKLELLNKTTRKYILAEAQRLRNECTAAHKDMIYDAPLLFEAQLDRECDCVIAITADMEKRIERIVARDGISRNAACDRLNSQHDNDYYESRSEFCVRNNGTTAELYEKLADILEEIYDSHS